MVLFLSVASCLGSDHGPSSWTSINISLSRNPYRGRFSLPVIRLMTIPYSGRCTMRRASAEPGSRSVYGFTLAEIIMEGYSIHGHPTVVTSERDIVGTA